MVIAEWAVDRSLVIFLRNLEAQPLGDVDDVLVPLELLDIGHAFTALA